ncbi:hypothetical protein MRX96_021263 [Rhipicephalus microplus]
MKVTLFFVAVALVLTATHGNLHRLSSLRLPTQPEDTAYFAPEDITIEHIRRIANLLNKVADSVEKGEKVYLFD